MSQTSKSGTNLRFEALAALMWPGHKAWRVSALVATAIVGTVLLAGCWLHESRPTGKPGASADTLARSMMEAAGATEWQQTGAVSFRFAGKHLHVWDRTGKRAAVMWDDCRAFFSTDTKKGRVWCDKKEITQREEQKERLADAYSYWINDTFWLAAPYKVFDEGTARAIVADDGAPQLLVSYASGGLTPGDAYLWTIGKTGRPSAWNMWVSIIPIGGVRASWEGWIRTETGAWISTRHAIGPLTLRLDDVHTAPALSALKGFENTFNDLHP